jgi:omega-amidase
MRVAALQLDVHPEDVARNLEQVHQGLIEAAREDVRLVVLPEMWPTSFVRDVDASHVDASTRALAELASWSRELGVIVSGSAYGPGKSLPTNRLHVFEDGQEVLSYEKVHLFSPAAEHLGFSAGTAPPATIDTSIGRLSGVVCYDLRFPEVLRVPFRDGVEIFAVSAQWATPRAQQWRALAIGRAVEAQCFVIACNRTGSSLIGRRQLELVFPGNSLIVDPYGEVLAEGEGEVGLVSAEIDLDAGRRLRTRIPVDKDERRDLYRDWN